MVLQAQSPQPANIATSMASSRTLSRVTTQLHEDQIVALRALFKEAMVGRFRGRVTDLARTLRRAQPSISDFVNGKGGVSFETAKRFAESVDSRARAILGIGGEGPPSTRVNGTALERGAEMARLQHVHEDAIANALLQLSGQTFADADEAYNAIKVIARMAIREMAEKSPLGKKPRKKRAISTSETAQPARIKIRRRATG